MKDPLTSVPLSEGLLVSHTLYHMTLRLCCPSHRRLYQDGHLGTAFSLFPMSILPFYFGEEPQLLAGWQCTQPSEVELLSRVWLFATPWTVAHQAPPPMGFSRQEYWSGLPFPSPGDLPNPGIKPGSPALQTDALPSEPPGKLYFGTQPK